MSSIGPMIGTATFLNVSNVTLTTHGTTYTFLASNVANLTTIFTPPASCATPCYFPDDTSRSDVALIGTACSYSGNDHAGCEPGSFNTSAIVFPYYSPGICPQGYTTACSPISEISFSANVTAQVCCPTGFQCNHYDYQGDYSAQCFSYVPVSATIIPDFLSATTTDADGLTEYTSVTASPVTSIFTVAYAGITVAWEATDTEILALLASSSSSAASAGSSGTTAASFSPATTQPPTHSSTAQPGKSGLSTGAKAGIGVGVAIAVLLIIGGILLYVRRLKKALKASKVAEPEQQLKPELAATEKKKAAPVEVEGAHSAHELAVNEIPVELDGNEVGDARRSET